MGGIILDKSMGFSEANSLALELNFCGPAFFEELPLLTVFELLLDTFFEVLGPGEVPLL